MSAPEIDPPRPPIAPEREEDRTAANAAIEDDFDAFARAELAAWEERDKEGRP